MSTKSFRIYNPTTGKLSTINGKIRRVSSNSPAFIEATTRLGYKVVFGTDLLVPPNTDYDELYRKGLLVRNFDLYDSRGQLVTRADGLVKVSSDSELYEELKKEGYIETSMALYHPEGYKIRQKQVAQIIEDVRQKELERLRQEELARLEKIKLLKISEKPVTTRKLNKTDRFRYFHRATYEVDGSTNLESLYQSMLDISKENGRRDIYFTTKVVEPDGNARFITFSPDKVDSFERFSKHWDNLRNDEVFGSDPLLPGSVIDTSFVDGYWFDVAGNGLKNMPFFLKTTPEEAEILKKIKKNPDSPLAKNCMARAINYFCPKIKLSDGLDNYIDARRELDVHLVELELCLDYLCDYDKMDFKLMRLFDGKDKKEYYLSELKGEPYDIGTKLFSDDKTGYECPEEPYEKTIKLAVYDNHYIPYIGLKDGKFYVDANKNYYHVIGDRIVDHMKKGEMMEDVYKRANYLNDIYTTEIVSFDLETVFDADSEYLLKPYSISFQTQDYDYHQCKCDRKCEREHEILKKAHFYMGEDCVDKMLDYLIAHQKNRKYCLLGYNSSRFDNIILLPALRRKDLLDDVFYQKNSVLNVKWGGRHTVHDICRFTISSLASACENFKTTYRKVGDFEHESIQHYYNSFKTLSSFFHDMNCEQAFNPQNELISVPMHVAEFVPHNLSRPHTFGMITGDACDRLTEEERCEQSTRGTDICKIFHSDDPKKREKIDKMRKSSEKLKADICSVMKCSCDKFRKLVEYNMFDVCSTYELYDKIEQVMTQNGAITKRLFDHKTIGSIIYKSFEDSTTNIKLPRVELEVYKRIRGGLVAGRTQCYYGVSHDLSRKNKYVMLDVKSLYPYVMLGRDFPCGELVNGNFADCMKQGLIGFYNCKINQSALKKNVLPRRSESLPLDWNYKGDMELFINTIDIRCLIDAGAKVEVLQRVALTKAGKPRSRKGKPVMEDDGFYFTEKIRGEILFGCLLKWKLIKEQQDLIKKYNDDLARHYLSPEERAETQVAIDAIRDQVDVTRTNVVLRNMAKTFLNSLSGKVIEQIHLDTTALVKNARDMDSVLRNAISTKDIQLSAILGPGTGLVTYKRDEKKEYKRQYRPLYLGVLIYAYARDHMYRSVLADFDVIYQDTDSALMTNSEYERFTREKADLLGDNFGQFALEDNSELFDSYVTLSPKNYFIFGEKGGKYQILKKGFKGVRLDKDKFVADPEQYVDHITYTMSSKQGKIYNLVGVSPSSRGVHQADTRKDLEPVNRHRAFDLYYNLYDKQQYGHFEPLKPVKQDIDRFIETILKNGHAYVLTSSLTKTLKNSFKSGQFAGAIYQRFVLKKITLTDVDRFSSHVNPRAKFIED